jgi:hypothetical protein
MLDLADYFNASFYRGEHGLLDTSARHEVCRGALIALVAFNLVMLFRRTRPAQDG